MLQIFNNVFQKLSFCISLKITLLKSLNTRLYNLSVKLYGNVIKTNEA